MAEKIKGLPLVAHNRPFDESCLKAVFEDQIGYILPAFPLEDSLWQLASCHRRQDIALLPENRRFENVAKEFYGDDVFINLPPKGFFDVTCQGCVPLALYIASIASDHKRQAFYFLCHLRPHFRECRLSVSIPTGESVDLSSPICINGRPPSCAL